MDTTEESTVTAEGRLGLHDALQHFRLHTMRKMAVIGVIALIPIYIVFHLQFAMGVIGTAAITLLIEAAGMLAGWMILKYKFKKQNQRNPMMKDGVTYIFQPDGFYEKRAEETAFMEWHRLEGVRERRDFFQLYLTKEQAVVVPKHFFTGETDIQQFREILRHQKEWQNIRLR
ncbi:YcxB family protein [Salibacterium halotolerans]|uniref:YcxB-like protein n=1 Tax=Salibacterium halotolerans TaxID=1884432 RepID=A0A1I5PIQ4_9BACI|nr:YcxB family protein [Salibacterium halotolerans]SFP33416.1 YcxB-like protein [Salibacterium halotolerans]